MVDGTYWEIEVRHFSSLKLTHCRVLLQDIGAQSVVWDLHGLLLLSLNSFINIQV